MTSNMIRDPPAMAFGFKELFLEWIQERRVYYQHIPYNGTPTLRRIDPKTKTSHTGPPIWKRSLKRKRDDSSTLLLHWPVQIRYNISYQTITSSQFVSKGVQFSGRLGARLPGLSITVTKSVPPNQQRTSKGGKNDPARIGYTVLGTQVGHSHLW